MSRNTAEPVEQPEPVERPEGEPFPGETGNEPVVPQPAPDDAPADDSTDDSA